MGGEEEMERNTDRYIGNVQRTEAGWSVLRIYFIFFGGGGGETEKNTLTGNVQSREAGMIVLGLDGGGGGGGENTDRFTLVMYRVEAGLGEGGGGGEHWQIYIGNVQSRGRIVGGGGGENTDRFTLVMYRVEAGLWGWGGENTDRFTLVMYRVEAGLWGGEGGEHWQIYIGNVQSRGRIVGVGGGGRTLTDLHW